MTLAAWIATMKAAGQKPISSGDPVIDYAMEIGLTPDMLHVQLHHFTQVFTQDRAGKQHTDWQAQFRESVRGNWFGLWHFDPSLGPTWTSKGQQALSSYAASQQAQPTEQASQPAATPASSAAGDHGTVGGDPKAQQPASVRPASGPASPENGPTGRFSGPEGSSGATDPRKPAQNGPTADQKRSAYPPLPRMTA